MNTSIFFNVNIGDFIGDDEVTGIVLDNESYKRKKRK